MRANKLVLMAVKTMSEEDRVRLCRKNLITVKPGGDEWLNRDGTWPVGKGGSVAALTHLFKNYAMEDIRGIR